MNPFSVEGWSFSMVDKLLVYVHQLKNVSITEITMQPPQKRFNKWPINSRRAVIPKHARTRARDKPPRFHHHLLSHISSEDVGAGGENASRPPEYPDSEALTIAVPAAEEKDWFESSFSPIPEASTPPRVVPLPTSAGVFVEPRPMGLAIAFSASVSKSVPWVLGVLA